MSGNANQTLEAVCSGDSSIVSRHIGVEGTAEDGFDLAGSASAAEASSSVPTCAAPLMANEAELAEFNDNATRKQPTFCN